METPEERPAPAELERRIADALRQAEEAANDGPWAKMWTVDQMVRILCGCPLVLQHPNGFRAYGENPAYRAWVAAFEHPPDGQVYEWSTGIAP